MIGARRRAAERRKQPLANILDEALCTTHLAGYRRVELNNDFLACSLKDQTLTLLENNNLEPSIIVAEGPLYTRPARRRAEPESRIWRG